MKATIDFDRFTSMSHKLLYDLALCDDCSHDQLAAAAAAFSIVVSEFFGKGEPEHTFRAAMEEAFDKAAHAKVLRRANRN